MEFDEKVDLQPNDRLGQIICEDCGIAFCAWSALNASFPSLLIMHMIIYFFVSDLNIGSKGRLANYGLLELSFHIW